jgi:hypothetical protein
MQFGWLVGRLAGGLGLVQIVFRAQTSTPPQHFSRQLHIPLYALFLAMNYSEL